MVSDVSPDRTKQAPEKNTPPRNNDNKDKPAAPPISNESTTSSLLLETIPTNSPNPTKHPGLWILGFCIVIGGLVVYSNDDHKYDNSNYTPSPTPQVSAPTEITPPVTAPITLVEEMPPAGENLVLTTPQVRWCVYEQARLQEMKDLVSSDNELAAFNLVLAQYNERCVHFQYQQGTLESIQQELNQEGKRLQGEGAARILALRAQPATPNPQGVIAANPDGQGAPQDNSGSAEDQKSKEPSAGLEIIKSGFGLINPTNSGLPTFQIASSVPFKHGQGYGWYIELKDTNQRVKWREELTLPEAPGVWDTQESTAHHVISADKKTLSTEREVLPDNGVIRNTWAVDKDDPRGAYIIKVFLEDKLVRTYNFRVE